MVVYVKWANDAHRAWDLLTAEAWSENPRLGNEPPTRQAPEHLAGEFPNHN